MARITVARTFSGHSNAKYKAKYFKCLSALAPTTVHVFTYQRPGLCFGHVLCVMTTTHLYQIICVSQNVIMFLSINF